MKYFTAVCLLVWVLVISGCTDTKQLSQSELFEKKQECAKYKDGLQNEIDKSQNKVEQASGYYLETIVEVFYSPTKNSCFAITNERSSRDLKEYNDYKWIIDLLSNENTNYKNNSDDIIYFNEQVKELKGE